MPRGTSAEKIKAIEFYGGRCHLVDDPATIYDESRRLANELKGHRRARETARSGPAGRAGRAFEIGQRHGALVATAQHGDRPVGLAAREVARRLREAGCIIVAKVNLSEWAASGGSVSTVTDVEVLKAGAVPNDEQHARLWTQRKVLIQEHVDARAGGVGQVVEDDPAA